MSLDAWFGPRTEPTNDVGDMTNPDGVWYAKAKAEGPSAWRDRRNPITERVALSLASDAELPLDGEAGRDCRRVAAGLLAEGGETLILRAQEICRRQPNWRGLPLYVQRKSLVHEMARIRAARARFGELLDADPVEVEDPLIECRKCGKRVLPEREADDCRGH